MTVVKTGYKTTVGMMSPTRNLDEAIKKALITTNLAERNFGVRSLNNIHPIFVSGIDSEESHIPAFIHPYLIENFKGNNYLVTDIRSFKNSANTYESEHEFEENVRNKAEYALCKNRAVLELQWLAGQQSQIRKNFSFAVNVFSAWISQAISKSYGLDIHDQYRIMAVAIYYYNTLFVQENVLDSETLEIAVIHTIKATKLPEKEIREIFNSVPKLNDANDLPLAIEQVVQNIRLKNFNLAILLTLIANTWYGNNAKDLIAVSLEYPPVWISIVFAAMTERSYKSSQIYRIIEAQSRSGNVAEFKLNFVDNLDHVMVAESLTEIEFREFNDD